MSERRTLPETLLFTDDGVFPNNPDLPVLIYRKALKTGGNQDLAERFEAQFQENDRRSE